jgi:hypothetical protein
VILSVTGEGGMIVRLEDREGFSANTGINEIKINHVM